MHPRPTVVHLTSVHTAFDVRVFHKECKSLARSGKDVVLIAPHPSGRVVDSVEVKGIRSSGGRFVRMTRTAWRLYREALRQNGDVYHFHDPELIPLGLLLAARHLEHVVAHVLEHAPHVHIRHLHAPGKGFGKRAVAAVAVERLLPVLGGEGGIFAGFRFGRRGQATANRARIIVSSSCSF